MARNMIAKEWQSYRESAVTPNAGAVQITETRRAFFAGAAALYSIVMQGLSPEPEATDADLALMADLHEELLQFSLRVSDGGN